MNNNKIIYCNPVKFGSDSYSVERVRVVTTSPKFGTTSYYYEVHHGKDSMGNELWRKANGEEETKIKVKIAEDYLAALRDEVYKENS